MTAFTEAAVGLARADFDRVLAHFAEIGVPVVEDRDLAWERFARRRSEYEPIVEQFRALVDAPSSDWRIIETSR